MPISRRRPAPRTPRPATGTVPPATAGRRPPRGPRRRILGRVATALLAGLAILLLSRLGFLDKLGIAPGPDLNWTNDYRLVEYLRGRVVRDGLTRTRKDCLLFIINGNDPPTSVRMRVMEKHSGSCPAAAPGADALPLLFTLLVNRENRTVQDDAGTPGRFRPLP